MNPKEYVEGHLNQGDLFRTMATIVSMARQVLADDENTDEMREVALESLKNVEERLVFMRDMCDVSIKKQD